MKSVLRSTFTTQGELGHLCPSDVQIRAPRGLAVMVTSLSVPRVMVLQAPRHRPTAVIVNIKVFMANPLVRWLRNGRRTGRRCILEEGAARECRPAPRLGCSIAALLVFERHLQLGAEQLDLAVLELHVLRRDLSDAEVAEGLRRALDRGPRRLLPRLAARADKLDDFVDAVGGHALLPGFRHRDGRMAAAI